MQKLQDQIENVEKRSKKIEADMKRLMSEALEKKKAKDTRGKSRNYSLVILMK